MSRSISTNPKISKSTRSVSGVTGLSNTTSKPTTTTTSLFPASSRSLYNTPSFSLASLSNVKLIASRSSKKNLQSPASPNASVATSKSKKTVTIELPTTDNRKKIRTKFKSSRTNEDATSSSYSTPSRGLVVCEEYVDSFLLERTSPSLTSYETDMEGTTYRTPVPGIRNINYGHPTHKGESTTPQSHPKYVYTSDRVTSKPDDRAPRYIPMRPKRTPFTHFDTGRKTFTSRLFLNSLITPDDREIAAYNRKKIQDRKNQIYEEWKINELKNAEEKSYSGTCIMVENTSSNESSFEIEL